MKVLFNFDTGARRIRLRAEDVLEEVILQEMAYLCEKGVNMKIYNIPDPPGTTIKVDAPGKEVRSQFEIEMKITGFSEAKEKKSE